MFAGPQGLVSRVLKQAKSCELRKTAEYVKERLKRNEKIVKDVLSVGHATPKDTLGCPGL